MKIIYFDINNTLYLHKTNSTNYYIHCNGDHIKINNFDHQILKSYLIIDHGYISIKSAVIQRESRYYDIK